MIGLLGITVALEGTNITGTTDSTGHWELHNVPAGIYNFVWSKPGFSTYAASLEKLAGQHPIRPRQPRRFCGEPAHLMGV